MKKILLAGLVMLCISATASAQQLSQHPDRKFRVEKPFKKGEVNKFENRRHAKPGFRHYMRKHHHRKDGIARKYGKRKRDAFRFKKGNTTAPFKYKGTRRSI